MLWKCEVCNFIWEGDNPPEVCPKCGSPREKYARVGDDVVASITRSRKTNALHVELLTLMPRLLEIAEQGIADNLDPRCLTIFKRLESDARFLNTSIKAELEGHVKRNKWG